MDSRNYGKIIDNNMKFSNYKTGSSQEPYKLQN